MHYLFSVNHSLSNHPESNRANLDHQCTEQQRRNWKDHHSSQHCGRTLHGGQESPPHRLGPSRKRHNWHRLSEGDPSQYSLQSPVTDQESRRNHPLYEIPELVPSPEQPRPGQRRSRTVKYARTRIHPTRSTRPNQRPVQHDHNRLPTKHRTTHSQRASNLRPSPDTSPVRILPHGRPPNTHQSHGPRQVKTPSIIRLQSRTDNVRWQNSTLAKSPVTSLEQLRPTSSEDCDSTVRQNGRGPKQGTSGNSLSSKEPCIGTVQSTNQRTIADSIACRSLAARAS